jgi:hypothetical protein
MGQLLIDLILKHRSELIILGVGVVARLVEKSKMRSRYKFIIDGLLEDIRKLKGGKEGE